MGVIKRLQASLMKELLLNTKVKMYDPEDDETNDDDSWFDDHATYGSEE